MKNQRQIASAHPNAQRPFGNRPAGRVLAALTLGAVALANSAWSAFVPKDGWKTSRFAKIEGNRLVVDVPREHAREGGSARCSVDLKPFRGRGFRATVAAEGSKIAKPAKPWLGFKFMLHYRDAAGNPFWPGARGRVGSFARETVVCRVFEPGFDATTGELTLGLQETSGRVTFDLDTLEIVPTEPLWPITNLTRRVAYPASVRDRAPLRGVMSPSRPMTEDDFKTLASWGATLLRYQIVGKFLAIGEDRDLAAYDRWLGGKLDHLEKTVIPLARKYGLRVVIDLHNPPGGRIESKDWRMYYEPRYAEHFVALWGMIARRFAPYGDVVYGYDLDNEPIQSDRAAPDCDYWSVQRRAAEAVRAADPKTPIIVESNGWDSSDTFRYLCPLDLDNVIYQVHLYDPHAYTHQGVGGNPAGGDRFYPNEAKGWNRELLRRTLEPVRAFEKRHGARIYVGEFSAIGWAQGAEKYLADAISLFREYGWDWTYHAFREWDGWSVEHAHGEPGKPGVAVSDTPRKRILLKGLRGEDPRSRF